MTDKELVINIKTAIDTSNLTKALDDVSKKADATQKSLDDAGKSGKTAGTSFTSMAGNVMKGVLAADIFKKGLSFLTDALMKNQKVADLVNTAMNAISIIMNDVVNVIVNVVEQVYKSSNGFQALGKVIMGFINLALTPLKASFYTVKLVILELQKAWEESFFGDKDAVKIAELTKSIDGTKQSLIEVGEKAIQSGKDIYNNMGEAVKSVGDVVSGVVDGISKIDIKADIAMAKRITGLQKNNDLLIAQAAGRAAEADRAAEKERQLRDDTNLSIKDREAANARLLIHLDEEKKAMMDISNLEIAKAQSDIKLNNNQENAVKLQEALNSKKEAAATMEGKYSEQKMNSVNLQKEEIALQKSYSDGMAKISIEDQKATNSRIQNIGDRLNAELKTLNDIKLAEEVRLQNSVNLFTEGTQARQDAQLALTAYIVNSENEIAAKKQEIRNYEIAQDKIAADLKIKNEEEIAAKKKASFQNDINIANAGLSAASNLADSLSSLNDAWLANKTKGLKKGSVEEQKYAKQAFERNKKLQISMAIISGIQGVIGAVTSAMSLPAPASFIVGAIQAAAVAISTAANIAKIRATQFGSTSGGGEAPSAPSGADLQAGATVGLGEEKLALQRPESNFQRVYVTEGDIRSTTSKVEVIEGRAVLGK